MLSVWRAVFREECSRVQRLFAALIISPRSSLLVVWGSSLEPRIFHRWGSGRLAVVAAPEDGVEGGN